MVNFVKYVVRIWGIRDWNQDGYSTLKDAQVALAKARECRGAYEIYGKRFEGGWFKFDGDSARPVWETIQWTQQK